MTDFHKYFLTNIFEGLEEKHDAEDAKDSVDIMSLGEKVKLAKSANIDALAFFERCFQGGLSMKDAMAALDAEIAKAPTNPSAAGDPPKS